MAVVVAAPTTTSRNRKLLNQNTPTSSSPSSPPPPAASSSSSSSTARKPLVPFSTFDTSMILTIIFLLATIFLISLFSCYVRRFSSSSPNEISRRRRRRQHRRRSTTSLQSIGSSSFGLDISTIQSLPIFSLDENAKNKDTRLSTTTTTTTTDCCICLSEFEESETVKVIPYCGHVFHLDCIDTWFLSHVSCPLCRSIQLFATKDGTCSLDGMLAVEPECESHQEEGSTVTSSIERETQVPPSTTTTTTAVGVRSISSCFELQKSSSFSEEECTLG